MMSHAGLLRRVALLEAARQAQDVPPEGLSAVLAWLRRHPPSDDPDPDPGPLTGLGRLLAEAKDFLQKGEDHHG